MRGSFCQTARVRQMGNAESFELKLKNTFQFHSPSMSLALAVSPSVSAFLSISFSVSPTCMQPSMPQPGPAASRWLTSSSAHMSSSISITLRVSGRQVREEDYGRTGLAPR